MQIDEEEIIREYREAKRQGEQVRILADLNACKKEDILRILILHGIDISPAGPNRWFGTGQDKIYGFLCETLSEMLESCNAADQNLLNALKSMEMYQETAKRRLEKRKKKAPFK